MFAAQTVRAPAHLHARWGVLLALAVFSLVLLLVAGSGRTSAASSSIYPWEQLVTQYQASTVPEHRLILASAYANLGRLEDAFAIFQELSQGAYTELGQAVIKKYSARTQKDPKDILAWNLQAFAHYALTQYDDAIASFQQVVRLDPANVWPRHFLALSLAAVDRIDEGVAVLEEALSLDEGNQYTHLLLAMGYYEQKRYVSAVWHLLRSPQAAAKLARYGIKVGK